MSTISAIIPTFNRKHFLPECVDSILSQTRPVDEILIIDDGSSDGTEQVVSKMSGPIVYHRQENTGKSGALNAGLRMASSDYIWICDDDDIALPHAAERLGGALDDASSTFSFGRYNRFTDEGTRNIYDGGYWPSNATDTWIALLEDFFFHQFGMMVRKTAYDAVGPFRVDLMRSQDYEMAIRLARHGRASYIDEPVFLQRVHGGERGSAQDRFSASNQLRKWMEYDKVVFLELHKGLMLSEYAEDKRQALTQRACIMFRHGLFEEALEDLRSASSMGRDSAPASGEASIANRFLLGKYGCEQLAAGALAEEMRDALGARTWGRMIRMEIAKPLVWRARTSFQNGHVHLGRGYIKALLHLAGLSGSVQTCIGSALTKLQGLELSKR